ncbi:MAG: toll/interleukin-1 receptor domain-containing protein [Anaerolineae bacterium]|nr:toll/interleukin-1 receptor domain-containing protein [Anaerolineae bacterium]
MSDVMISYSRKDTDFVRRLHQALSQQKREGWVDWEGIPLTADWWSEICHAIESADTFLFVISPDSLTSPVCHLEIDHARRHNKRLVPIVRRPSDPTEAFGVLAAIPADANTQARLGGRDLLAIARDNWNALSRHNWLTFDQDAEFTANFQKLITALDMDLDYIRQHTRLLMRAKEWETARRIGASLLRDEELAAAQQWLASSGGKDPGPSELHTQYIFESAQEQQRLEQAEREQQARELLFQKRAANRARYLAGVSALAAVVGIALSLFAFSQFTRAQDEADNRGTQERIAVNEAQSRGTQEQIAVAAAATADRRAIESQSLFLAGAAQELTDSGDSLGLTLALAAVEVEDPPGEAQRALADAAYPAGIAYEFPIHTITGNPSLDAAPTFLVEYSALSADGRWAAGKVYDRDLQQQKIMIWDVQRRTRHDIPIPAEVDGVVDVYFHPTDANQLALLTVSVLENNVRIYPVYIVDPATGIVQDMYYNDETVTYGVVWGNNGHLYLLEATDPTGPLRVWDATISRELVTVRTAPTLFFNVGFANPFALSADGERLAYIAEDETLRVVSTNLGVPVLEQPTSLRGVLLALNDDGSRLAIYTDNVVQVLDVASGSVLLNAAWPNQTIRSMTLDAAGRTLAMGAYNSGSSLPSLRVWDVDRGRELISSAASFDVQQVAITNDGQWVLTNSDQITRRNNLVLWAVRSADVVLDTQMEFSGALWRLKFSDDSQTLRVTNQAGAEGDPLSVDLDLATGEESSIILDVPIIETPDVWFSANGAYSVTSAPATVDYEITLTDAAGSTVATWPFSGNVAADFSTIFRPSEDGRWVAVGGCDEYINITTGECGRANVWLFEVGRETPQIWLSHTGSITAFAWSPDGEFLVSADTRMLLVVWDVATGQAMRYFRGHSNTTGPLNNQIVAMVVSPDGQSIASLEWYGRLIVWRVDTLSELIAWSRANRYVRDLTCNERLQYRIEPYCSADYVVPTSTPFAP